MKPRGIRMTIVGAILFVGVLAGFAGAADAHPLGNYTVNHYARVEVSAGRVRVYYVQDSAEIPAFQVRHQVDADRAGYLRAEVERLRAGLSLAVDGHPVALRAAQTGLDRPKGEAGLLTLRVAAIYEARLPRSATGATVSLTFADRNEPRRLGWREIVIVARGDTHLRSSTAPSHDLSDELRRYPGNLIQAPLDLRSARATFVPGSAPVAAAPLPRSAAPPKRSGDSLTELVTRQNIGAGVLAGMLAVAFGIGAAHAFLPGHGKTLMGAYLVGTKGRPVDAFLLGAIVSLMHTGSVLVLGLVLFRVNRSVSLERIYPSLTVMSGLLAAAFGAFLLVTRYRRIRRARQAHVASHLHEHEHDHEHHHEHDHIHEPELVLAGVGAVLEDGAPGSRVPRPREHGFGHSHGPGQWHTHELPPDVPPFSRRGIVMLATSGGLVPSPSAVLVLVSAFSLGRIALGLSLIAAFSIGLAGTLTAIGLSLVFGRGFVERHWGRSLQILPVIGAAVMIVAGLALAMKGYLAG
jgi:ABC-type nickel/cobalt efflux system permease component RcnA